MKSRDKRRKRKRRAQEPNWAKWRQSTDAEVLDEASFLAHKAKQELYVLGVMGYAGSWRHAPYQGAQLESWIQAMEAALADALLSYQEQYGERLVVASGATLFGVLAITYQLCERYGIACMGITSDRALQYELASMRYVLPWGRSFGDESDLFVRTCDSFVLLGGGSQSKRESVAADQQGKCVAVLQGFGGAADAFTPTMLPYGIFIACDVDVEGAQLSMSL